MVNCAPLRVASSVPGPYMLQGGTTEFERA